MNVRSLGLTILAYLVMAISARAAAVPISVKCTSIYAIQTYNLGETAVDDCYLLVTGTADGKTIDARFPQSGSWKAAPKQQPIEASKPIELWKGQLEDGHYLLLNVTLMQGEGENAAQTKEYVGKLRSAEKAVPGLSKPTLSSNDDLKKLATDVLKADQGVISKIKTIYSRDKKTDHYSANFTMILWNNGGKIMKRLDPVGLTFGEHNGLDEKIYTKLKNTRNNLIAKNEKGEWEMVQYEPTSDDASEVRVKGLETEMIKQPGGNPLRHVTDYLVGITVTADGKPVTWTPEDLQNNIDAIHQYFNYAD